MMISQRVAKLAEEDCLLVSMPVAVHAMTGILRMSIDRDCVVSVVYQDGEREAANCRALLSEMSEDDIDVFRILSYVQSKRAS